MAAVLENSEEHVDAPAMGAGGSPSVTAGLAVKARRGSRYEDMFTGTAKNVVKGVGHVSLAGDRGSTGRPLSDAEHGTEIMTRSRDLILKSRAGAYSGAWETGDVLGGISPEFWSNPAVATRYPALYHQVAESAATRKSYAAQVGKNFTAGNLGLSGTPYGLVPFDLLAPSRLIYPIYTLN